LCVCLKVGFVGCRFVVFWVVFLDSCRGGISCVLPLKLWVDRGYRQLGFGVESEDNGKSFYVDVLANGDNGMVGVECASSLHLGWLRWQVKQLRRYLPPNSYIIIVFPETVGEQAEKAVELADEVGVTGKDGTVERMLFTSVFHKG
jgi:hypothetical protein